MELTPTLLYVGAWLLSTLLLCATTSASSLPLPLSDNDDHVERVRYYGGSMAGRPRLRVASWSSHRYYSGYGDDEDDDDFSGSGSGNFNYGVKRVGVIDMENSHNDDDNEDIYLEQQKPKPVFTYTQKPNSNPVGAAPTIASSLATTLVTCIVTTLFARICSSSIWLNG